MNASTVKMHEALLDVRKAYRLLHDYQRMALERGQIHRHSVGHDV